MKIDLIPLGKENRISRDALKIKTKCSDDNLLNKQLSELKKDNIIIYDNGYYRPSTKKEYEEFMNKCNKRKSEMYELIVLAKREMEMKYSERIS